MLEKKDFIWKVSKINNIRTNPIDEYFCIIRDKTSDFAKKYSITFHYPILKDENGLYYRKGTYNTLEECISHARYFVVNEVRGRKMTLIELELAREMYSDDEYTKDYYEGEYGAYSGYEFENKGEGIILETFEDAIDYLYTMNFNFHIRYVNAFINENEEEYNKELDKWICDTEGDYK